MRNAICIAALSILSSTANAFPIAAPGTEGNYVFVAVTGPVFATYQGNSATYSNNLRLNGVFIFNNQTTPVGTTVNLGTFTAGTELLFELAVTNTGYSYYSGPGSRNPDGHTHARAESNWAPSTTLVSFEDLFNGPFDYNDLSFSFTNTISSPMPESSTVALFTLGIAAVLGYGRNRRRAAA